MSKTEGALFYVAMVNLYPRRQILICRIQHPKSKILHSSRTRSDLECFGPTFNKYASRKNAKQLRQNQHSPSDLSFILLAFLQNTYLSNFGLEYSRSILVFEQSKLLNNFTFGMLYSGN